MKKFTGLIPPMVTPLAAPDKLDVKSTERMVKHLLDGGVDGIFLLGTTGEGPHLPYAVRKALVKKVCATVRRRVPVLVGITETDLEDALAFATECKAFGASGVVAAPPYYFKLTQRECVAWFRELADRLPLPLVIYDMPAHTDTVIEPATIAELARHPNIVAMKDSSSVIALFNKFRVALKPFSKRFSLFMGPDEAMGEAVLLGADGGVCTGANLWPRTFKKMYEAAVRGDADEVRRLQEITTTSSYLLYGLGSGQIGFLKGVKAALAEMGLIKNVLTAPFAPFKGAELKPVREALKRLRKMGAEVAVIVLAAMSTAWAEVENFNSVNEPEKPVKATVTVDFAKTVGRVKPMNAVNNGPEGSGGTFRRSNAEAYRAANIPFARTHDSSEYIVYGGDHVVDVSAIFRDFDADENDPKNYDFAVTDAYMNRIRSVGTEPFYRLGQRIEHAVKRYNVFPPKDYAKWARICEHIIRHYNEGWANGFRHGIRYWEIWNEPDIDWGHPETPHMWGGTPEQFFAFFETAAKHLKAKFPSLKIGGPALAGNVKWGENFLKYQHDHGTPMDFFSWHIYAREPMSMARQATVFRDLMKKYGYGDKESILNEWNYVKGWKEDYYYSACKIGEQKGAAFTAAAMVACQKAPVDMLMYYNAQPTVIFNGLFEGVGLQPLKGYYAMYSWGKLLKLGTEVASASDAKDVYVMAARNEKGKRAIFVVRYSDDDNVSTPKPVAVKVSGVKLPGEIYAHATDETRMHTEMPVRAADGELRLFLPPRSFMLIEF